VDYYQRAAIAGESWTCQAGVDQDEVTYEGNTSDSMRHCPAEAISETVPAHLAAVHSDAAVESRAEQLPRLPEPDTDAVVAASSNLYRRPFGQECNHQALPAIFLQRQVHVAETDEKSPQEATTIPRLRCGASRRRPHCARRASAGGHTLTRHGPRQ